MSDNIAIQVRGLGKKYTIGGPQEKYLTVRDAITNSVKAPFRMLSRQSAIKSTNEFWALKEVSFDVEHGEVMGIIGRNGAGKSTLLKILSRITTPTEGAIDLYGRVGSLLEVGTGFHPEMTGRENVYLNGSILGMKKVNIEQKFDEIVRFAEIDKFIDTPVKRYSSGMYVRLAFAVAAHLEPEILVVDEVLAVGDAGFQKKCLGKMGEVAKEGRTVLFVSHNMGAVSTLCSTAIHLSEGKLFFKGPVSKTIDSYLKSMGQQNIEIITFDDNPQKEICILSVQVRSVDSHNNGTIDICDDIELIIKYKVRHDLKGTNIYIGLDHQGTNIIQVFDIDYDPSLFLLRKRGLYTLKIIIPKNFLKLGLWSISIDAGRPSIGVIDIHHYCLNFLIENFSIDITNSGLSRGGSINPPFSFQTVCE